IPVQQLLVHRDLHDLGRHGDGRPEIEVELKMMSKKNDEICFLKCGPKARVAGRISRPCTQWMALINDAAGKPQGEEGNAVLFDGALKLFAGIIERIITKQEYWTLRCRKFSQEFVGICRTKTRLHWFRWSGWQNIF